MDFKLTEHYHPDNFTGDQMLFSQMLLSEVVSIFGGET